MFGWLTGKRKREEEFMLNMMRAVAEGDSLRRLRQAIATVSTTELNEKSPSENAAIAAAALATAVVKRATADLDDDDDDDDLDLDDLEDLDLDGDDDKDDDRFLAGLFAFVYANYFSLLLAGQFEMAAPIAVLHTLRPGHFEKWFNPVLNYYNQASASNSNEILAIGKSCEHWYKEPTAENFDKIVKLFKICREHVSKP